MKLNKKVVKVLSQIAYRFGIFLAPDKPESIYVDRSRIRDAQVPVMPLTKKTEPFYRIAKEVIQEGRTLLRFERLFVIWQSLQNIRNMESKCSVAEVGVFKGGSSYFIASVCRELSLSPQIYAIDTFEGHPSSELRLELEPHQKPGMFGETSFKDVKKYLSEFNNVKVYKSEFSNIVNTLDKACSTFGFVHIDVDIYITTKNCLNFFIPRLVVGGIIILDDYGAGKCPGVEKAVDEVLAQRKDIYSWHMQTEQIVLCRAFS